MDAKKVVDEAGDQQQRVRLAFADGAIICVAQVGHSLRRFIGGERREESEGLAFRCGGADIILHVLERATEGAVRVAEHDLVQLEDIIRRQRDILEVIVDRVQRVAVSRDLLFIAAAGNGLFAHELTQARFRGADALDGYLKIDYNVDSGPGTDFDSDSLGDGLLKHNRAYIEWLNEVMDKYPHLTIENCGSGGCRMDYEILKYCPIQSTSDQTNYRKYPYLAANVLTACTPEQAAVWSYPLNDYEKIMPTDEVVVMNMCNAMLGRIHLASFIDKLPASQLDLIREGIRYYKSLVDFKKKALPIYPKGTSHFFDKEVIGGLIDGHRIILGVWNTSNKPRKIIINLEKYNVEKVAIGYPLSLATEYSFDEETKVLTVNFPENYGGRIFDLKIK